MNILNLNLKQVIEDPAELQKFTTPQPSFQVYDNWTDWESWEPSEDIAKGFPRYRSGYDLDGLVGMTVFFTLKIEPAG